MKTRNILSLMKSINNRKHTKSINNLYLVKALTEHVMRTRVLRQPLVFLGVNFSICVSCSILILLIQTVRCITVSLYHTPLCGSLLLCFLTCGFSAARMLGLWVRILPRGMDGLSIVSVVCCHVEVSASGRSLAQRNATEFNTSMCVRETSTLRWARSEYSRFATEIHTHTHTHTHIYIYIYI